MIKLQSLSKIYRMENVETTALNALSMEVEEGEFVAVMGPSGCGKSTLLNIVGMLDTPTSGQYIFNGEDVTGYSENKLAKVRKENIGFIFQSYNLIDELSVRENIELALLYHKDVSAKERKERTAQVMDKMGIAHRAGHMPPQLSGGQQQRVAVARALIVKPKLILADEPTGNLDTAHGQDVMNLIKGLNEDGTTVLMVTHDESHAAYANRTIGLLDGAIVNEDRIAA